MTNFSGEQYKKVMAACKERDKIPTQAWTPNNSEKFMAKVLKTELGESFEKIEDGVAVGIDFTQDSEYKRLFGEEP